MFSVHPVSPRSGFLPVALTDSVLTSVAGSGLTSPLGSVFSRTPERTPFPAHTAGQPVCQHWLVVLRQTRPGLGSPLGGHTYRRGGDGGWMIRFCGSSRS